MSEYPVHYLFIVFLFMESVTIITQICALQQFLHTDLVVN